MIENNNSEIPWDAFGPTVSHLALAARIRPEQMLAYTSSLLGGLSGIQSSMRGFLGEQINPSVSLIALSRNRSRLGVLDTLLLEPIRKLQDRSRLSQHVSQIPLPCSESAYFSESPNIVGRLLHNARERLSAEQAKERREFASEVRRFGRTFLVVSPDPESFENDCRETYDGMSLVIDPSGRLVSSASGSEKSTLPWRELIDDLVTYSRFGASKVPSSSSPLYGSNLTRRTPYLFHLPTEVAEDLWQEDFFQALAGGALLCPITKSMPVYPSETYRSRDACTVFQNSAAQLLLGRRRQTGVVQECDLLSKTFYAENEKYHDELDDLPGEIQPFCEALINLPMKFAWTSSFLEGGDPQEIGRSGLSAITAAKWCFQAHVETVRSMRSLSERRKLMAEGRQIYVKIRAQAPCTYRDLYRGTNHQKKSRIEPAIEFLQSEGALEIRGNRIEIPDGVEVPDWLATATDRSLN